MRSAPPVRKGRDKAIKDQTDPIKEGIFADMQPGVRLHFCDSGSFTLWTLAEKWAAEKGKQPEDYYLTNAFHDYIDSYAAFIKKHQHAIDHYANVDAIGFPDVTWNNQRYLERQHGLSPVPVVHYKTDLSWLEKYIRRDRHSLVALGGLVGSTSQEVCRDWLDRAFDIICDSSDRLPRVRTHGFGVTAHSLLFRYPWWSVDSTAWTMIGANGGVLVPYKKNDKWRFDIPALVVKFSNKAKEATLAGKHYFTMRKGERAVVLEWLAELGIPLGSCAAGGEILTYGVTNRHCERKAANLLYFERLRASIPKYPWPFAGPKKPSLGIKLNA